MSEKDILQRADELLKDESIESTSLTEDVQEDADTQIPLKPTEAEELLKIKDEDSQVFRLRRLGYRRKTHYKKPAWWMFVLGIILILFLIAIIGIQLPYIPPVI